MSTISVKPHTQPLAVPSRPGGTSIAGTIDPVKVIRRHALLFVLSALIGVFIGFGAYLLADRFAAKYSGRVGFELVPRLRDAKDTGRTPSQGEEVLRQMRTEAEYLVSLDVLDKALHDSKDARENTAWSKRYTDLSGVFAYDEAIADLREELDPVV